jgi:hypothetical protein
MVYDIFVSKPTAQSSRQSEFTLKLEKILETRDFKIRSVGTSDFPNEAPLLAVQKIMSCCQGAIILGLKQLHINKGILKPNTKSERKITDIDLPTPWNHIEAAMAFALKIPILIIREENIEGGIFDIGSSDRFIHQINIDAELDEYFQSAKFLQPFNQFVRDVITFANN